MLHSLPPAPSEIHDGLFDTWMPVVLGWCRRLGGPKIDAEDAAHDVFLVVMRRAHTVRDPSAFRAWLFGVTRKTLARHRRRAWVRRWMPGAETEERRVTGPGPESLANLAKVKDRVHEAVLALPERYREVVVLCDLEERPVVEVAELLGVPVDTVKTRRRRARQRLERSLRAVAHGHRR